MFETSIFLKEALNGNQTFIFYELFSEICIVCFYFFLPVLFFPPQYRLVLSTLSACPPYFFNAVLAIMDFKFETLFNLRGCSIVYTREEKLHKTCMYRYSLTALKNERTEINSFLAKHKSALLCSVLKHTKDRKTRKGCLSGNFSLF